MKTNEILGWVATFMSVMMYVSYFPQIMDNLAGHKGNFIQPLVAAINCSLWVYYGLFKRTRYPTCCSQCTRDHLWFDHSHHSLVINERESGTEIGNSLEFDFVVPPSAQS